LGACEPWKRLLGIEKRLLHQIRFVILGLEIDPELSIGEQLQISAKPIQKPSQRGPIPLPGGFH
jgi:hypothetical protein